MLTYVLLLCALTSVQAGFGPGLYPDEFGLITETPLGQWERLEPLAVDIYRRVTKPRSPAILLLELMVNSTSRFAVSVGEELAGATMKWVRGTFGVQPEQSLLDRTVARLYLWWYQDDCRGANILCSLFYREEYPDSFPWSSFDLDTILARFIGYHRAADLQELLGYDPGDSTWKDTAEFCVVFWITVGVILLMALWIKHCVGVTSRFSMAYIITPGVGALCWLLAQLDYRLTTPLPERRLRERFRDIELREGHPVGDHSHPLAASDRSNCNTLIDRFIRSVGAVPYSISMSARDFAAGNDGERYMYNAIDTSLHYRGDKIKQYHIIKFIDTDYYCDIAKYARHCLPMVMYTFVPVTAGGKCTDGHFSMAMDQVRVTINGKSTPYQHKIWNYDCDHIAFHYWYYSVMYKIQQRPTRDEQHKMYLFEPRRITYGPFMRWVGDAFTLARRVYAFGPINFVRTHTGCDTGPLISFSKMWSPVHISMSSAQLNNILVRSTQNINEPFRIGEVERLLRVEREGRQNVELDSSAIWEVLDWLRMASNTICHRPIETRLSWRDREVNYRPVGPIVDDDSRPTARVGAPAVVDSARAPVASQNSDVTMVLTRIGQTANPNYRVGQPYVGYMSEFLEHVIPSCLKNTGVPLDYAEVEAMQTRPSQVAGARRVQATFLLTPPKVESFMKRETYPKIAKPRVITTLSPDHRIGYGSYIYAISDLLKKQRWYAFGVHPKVWSDRLVDVAAKSKHLIPTDFSAFDGTHSDFLVDLECKFGLRFFGERYHKQWQSLLRAQYNRDAHTTLGARYKTGTARLSGSSDTSAFNSVDNAYVAYCVLRDSGLEPKQAYDMLGVYGGDDGLTGNVDEREYERVAKVFGLALKAERVERGFPVTFLGRTFRDPWSTRNSFADIVRHVRKLHVTTAPVCVPIGLAMRRKAEGYLATDKTTPIISNWSRAILRVIDLDPAWLRADGESKWETTVRNEMNWASRVWGSDVYYQALPDCPETLDAIAGQLQIPSGQVTAICAKFDQAQTLDDLDIGHQLEHLIDNAVDVPVLFRGEMMMGNRDFKQYTIDQLQYLVQPARQAGDALNQTDEPG